MEGEFVGHGLFRFSTTDEAGAVGVEEVGDGDRMK